MLEAEPGSVRELDRRNQLRRCAAADFRKGCRSNRGVSLCLTRQHVRPYVTSPHLATWQGDGWSWIGASDEPRCTIEHFALEVTLFWCFKAVAFGLLLSTLKRALCVGS